MDIFAHALWSNLAYYKKYKYNLKDRLWAVFFGIMPDLISFSPATLYAFFHFGKNQLLNLASSNVWVFVWARESYNYTHSLVSFIVLTAVIVALRRGKIYWPFFGWLLHLAIDFFTHPGFYSTPIFYPLSNYKNHNGISWAEPHFMFINYGLLVLLYIFIFYFKRQRRQSVG